MKYHTAQLNKMCVSVQVYYWSIAQTKRCSYQWVTLLVEICPIAKGILIKGWLMIKYQFAGGTGYTVESITLCFCVIRELRLIVSSTFMCWRESVDLSLFIARPFKLRSMKYGDCASLFYLCLGMLYARSFVHTHSIFRISHLLIWNYFRNKPLFDDR